MIIVKIGTGVVLVSGLCEDRCSFFLPIHIPMLCFLVEFRTISRNPTVFSPNVVLICLFSTGASPLANWKPRFHSWTWRIELSVYV
jgi:hypothetical protein